MKNLPVELLQQIFAFLDQDDQLECMLTCHLWKNMIEEYCLFQTLHIYSLEYMNGISKKLLQNPDLASHVEQLTIYLYQVNEADLTEFLQLFPHIRRFYFYGKYYSENLVDTKATIPWIKHVQKMVEIASYPVASHLLQQGVCPSLTELQIYEFDYDLFDNLKNAPFLTSLALHSHSFSIDDINKVHDSLPHLKTFKISDKEIYSWDLDIDTITPAPSVTEIAWTNIIHRKFEKQLGLIQLITKKYPNLEKLELSTNFVTKTSEDMDTLYTHGWQPLLQNIGHQLKKLYINNTSQISGFLGELDKYNCQVDDLKIHRFVKPDSFSWETLSQRVFNVRKFVLDDVWFTSVDFLKKFQFLETLEIPSRRFSRRIPIDLNELIEYAPPTLHSLTIGDIALSTKLINTRESTIKNLTFLGTNLYPETVRFLDRHFPLLSNLTMKNCEKRTRNFTFRLVDLNSLCLIDEYSTEPIIMQVRTTFDSEERWYSTKEERFHHESELHFDHSETEYPSVRPQSPTSIESLPDFIFCFYKVKKVILSR